MTGILRFSGRGVSLFFALFFVLPLVLAGIGASRTTGWENLQDRLVKGWSKFLLRVFGIQVEHRGTPAPHPVFLVANHVSWLDIPVIHSAKKAGFVAKAEIARWPVLGWVAKCGDTVFHQRGHSDSRQRVLRALRQRLQKGESVVVFPEGRATSGESVGRFHRQLLQAAVDVGSPIQPVAIEYWDNTGQRHYQLPFSPQENFLQNVKRLLCLPPGQARVHWLEPIPTRHKVGEEPPQTRWLANEAREKIIQKMRQDNYWPV